MEFTKETKLGKLRVVVTGIVWDNHGQRVVVRINGKEAVLPWVIRQGRTGMEIPSSETKRLLGKKLGTSVILEAPATNTKEIEAQFSALAAEKEQARQARIAAIKSGTAKLHVQWREGSILSGWTLVEDDAVDLLCDLGVAKPVGGWGFLVDAAFVAAVGQEFAYSDATAYVAPKIAAAKEKLVAAEEKLVAALAQAKATGVRVEIARHVVPCQSQEEECTADVVVQYATPAGNLETTTHHTW